MYWCGDDTKPKALSKWFMALSKDCMQQTHIRQKLNPKQQGVGGQAREGSGVGQWRYAMHDFGIARYVKGGKPSV